MIMDLRTMNKSKIQKHLERCFNLEAERTIANTGKLKVNNRFVISEERSKWLDENTFIGLMGKGPSLS